MRARSEAGTVPMLIGWGVRTIASRRVRRIGSRTPPGGDRGRVCLVCHRQVPDGLGVYQVHLRALTHQEGCNAVIAGLERVPGRTPRERKRPLHELRALANGARCSTCLGSGRR